MDNANQDLNRVGKTKCATVVRQLEALSGIYPVIMFSNSLRRDDFFSCDPCTPIP